MGFKYRNEPKKKGQPVDKREVIPGSAIKVLLDDDDRSKSMHPEESVPNELIPALGQHMYLMGIDHGDEMNGHVIISKDPKPKVSKERLAEIIALQDEAEIWNDGLNRIGWHKVENCKVLPFIDQYMQSKPHYKSLTIKDISYAWSLGIDYAFYVNSSSHAQCELYAGAVKKIKLALGAAYILEPGEKPDHFTSNEVYSFIRNPKPLELIFFYVAHYNEIVSAHQRRFKSFKAPKDPTPDLFPLLLNETIKVRARAAIEYLRRKGEPMGGYLAHLNDCSQDMMPVQKSALYLFRNLYDKMLKAFFKDKAKKNIELQKKVHENIDNISKVIGDHESAASSAVSKCVELIEKRYGADVAKDVGGVMFALNKRCSESLGKVNELARRNLYEASFRVADAGDKIAANHFKELCNFIEENTAVFQQDNTESPPTYNT